MPPPRSSVRPPSRVLAGTEQGTRPVVESSERKRVSARALTLLAVIALAVYAADQFAKLLVVQNLQEGERVPVLGQVLQFQYVQNSGAAFSLASGWTWIFSITATGVVVFIVIYASRIRSLSWAVLFGMLLGGTLGNLTDRLFREPSFGLGHVVDFILVYGFPAIFNIADSFIVASMGLFILLSVRGVTLDGHRAVKGGQEPAGQGPSGQGPSEQEPVEQGPAERGPAEPGPVEQDPAEQGNRADPGR